MVRGNAIHFSPPWMHNSAVIKLPCLQYHESFPLFLSNVLFISYPLHPLNHLLISYAQPVVIAVFYSFHLYSQQICLPWQPPTLDNHAAFTCFTCHHIIHIKNFINSYQFYITLPKNGQQHYNNPFISSLDPFSETISILV